MRKIIKKKLGNSKKYLKNFVKKHENIYKAVLMLWGIWCIIRAKFIFSKIKKNIEKRVVLKNNHKVLILAIRTLPTTNLVYFDAVFGHVFKRLGCDVKMLYCDGFLNSCDANTIFYSQRPQCFACKNLGPLMRNSLGLDCIFYRQYISDDDIREIKARVASLDTKEISGYKYLGVKVGLHAEASAIRYFLFGRLDLNKPEEVAALREKLIYAMIAVKVASNVVSKEHPDKLFLLHGIYSSWGPFLDYFHLKGIDTVVYLATSLRFGYFNFRDDRKINEIDMKKSWLNFSCSPLKPSEEAQLDDYFKKRIGGEITDQKMYAKNFQAKSGKQKLLSSLLEKKYSRRYVMYPNLAWDCSVEEGKKSKIFDNFFDWIDTTIEFFKKNKNYQLIIKSHPAELIWDKCSKTISKYIYEKHGLLPENITVLEPNAPLSAYDLIAPETICLVFSGTMGLELATLGVPVLVVAEMVHYKNAGAVYKIETLEEYLELLENPSKVISFTRDNLKLARKYAYYYLFKSMIRIPFYSDNIWAKINWSVLMNPEKLLDDENPIVKVCKKIIKREDIVVS